MKKIALATALLFSTPCFAATTSTQLMDLAVKIESSTAENHQFDKDALTLLAEPMQTYAGRTLPAPAAAPYYQRGMDLTLNSLRPPANWAFHFDELRNDITKTPFWLARWSPGTGPQGNIPGSLGSLGFSTVSKSSAILVSILRTWGHVLAANGR